MTITQSDREAAADFYRSAWHLFRPGDYDRAMKDAAQIVDGYCDYWRMVQAFARHAEQARLAERERCARLAEDWTMDWTRESAHIPSDIAQAIRSTQ